MPKQKNPKGLEDYRSLHIKNSHGDIIIDVLSLATGLNMAIEAIDPGKITKKARKALLELNTQSYLLFAYRIAIGIMRDEGLVKESTQPTDINIRFDTPDEQHDDLVIYYQEVTPGTLL